jgi:hypothetical protein
MRHTCTTKPAVQIKQATVLELLCGVTAEKDLRIKGTSL